MTQPTLCLAILLAIGCAGVSSGTAGASKTDTSISSAKGEDDIREAVFRYRMEKLRSDELIFLSINGRDPSNEFMARFARSQRKIKKASQSYVAQNGIPSLRDRTSDQPGWKFSANAITWVSSGRVEVQGDMYCGGLCADSGRYVLERKQGRWVVIKYKVEQVS